MNKKYIRGLRLAKEVASWSKDPSTRIGCIITDKLHRPISWGYNGFPRNIEDSEERLNNREIKYKYVIHAEANAIINSYTIERLRDSIMYVYPCQPCCECSKLISQVGISQVITIENKDMDQRWHESFHYSSMILKESNIELITLPYF